jgi:hypothetical protein
VLGTLEVACHHCSQHRVNNLGASNSRSDYLSSTQITVADGRSSGNGVEPGQLIVKNVHR